MRKTFILTFFAFLIINHILGQGIIRGKISDVNGELVTGATVVLKSTTNGVISDFDGNYSIKINDNLPHTLVISFVSYETIEETVTLNNGEILIKDFVLSPVNYQIEDAVIIGRAKKSRDIYMERLKMKSAESLDYISSQTIKQTGDSHVSDAIKRITGVSTAGGYVLVRGLADRYVKTAVNGSFIPTLDPLTNNIKLDIFPTSLIDNIIITKTMSPELPGDWAASYVSIETKDYPEKLSVEFSTTIGYNHQTTFKKVVSSKHSKTDWLGFDNGYRDLKNKGYDRGRVPEFIDNPFLYDQMIALGKEDFLLSMGITEENYMNANLFGISAWDSKFDSPIEKLCLIELGLITPGYINDEDMVTAATKKYMDTYYSQAFNEINKDAVAMAVKLPDNWETLKRTALPSLSQELSIGNQIHLFNRPLGYLFGLRYSKSVRYDPAAKATSLAGVSEGLDSLGRPKIFNYLGTREHTIENNGWSSLINLAYSISPNHNVSFMFMPNFIGVNRVYHSLNEYLEPFGTYSCHYRLISSQYYEERRNLIYQLKSSHFIPGPDIRIEAQASYTRGKSSIPDYKILRLTALENNYYYEGSEYPSRNYRYLYENVLDSRLSFEIPLAKETPGYIRKFKFGAAYQNTVRDNEQFYFRVNSNEGQSNVEVPGIENLEGIFGTNLFQIIDNKIRKYYGYQYYPSEFFRGFSEISAGYAMLDYSVGKLLRVSGGIRIENTTITTDAVDFDELNLPANDIRRRSNPYLPWYINPSEKSEINYLPSINLILKLANTEKLTVNSRFSYSESIGRPSLREYSVFIENDEILTDKYILGNPELKFVNIHNFDFRLESYLENGDNLSLSLFYKKIQNHIEINLDQNYITWQNTPFSEATGIELEGRKKLIWNLDIRANITFIESFSRINGSLTHDMYGQAPYIINTLLSYTGNKNGLTASLSHNVQGSKLVLVGIDRVNDVYELSQHLLDFKISKSIGRHFNLSFKARNILNSPLIRAYSYDKTYPINYDKYTYGTHYSIGISYTL
ncbi:MAG: carboxypeptidase-like regulatory domain-containing protein [Bacteroidales bacterium]|nr:carboxypeptidase-like regulatory domain-containing protein [Bacteroidales bacterium]